MDLIIVTGASKGIGANIVTKCSSICKQMIVIASSEAIFNLKTDNANCKIIPLQLDLTNYQNCYENLFKIINNLKDIKSIGIVLCGGKIGEHGGLFKSDLKEWDNLYQCNVLGNLAVVKACYELIQSGIKTRIIFFGGGGAAFPYPDFFGYALSKVAIVRAAENLSVELSNKNTDVSVIALAPGAVDTDILKKVIDSGSSIRTKTDISEPTNFVYRFLTDQLPTKELNGKFVHVRDDMNSDFTNKDLFNLRRIQ